MFSSLLRRFLQRAFLRCFASRFLHIRRAHGHTRPHHRRRQQQQRELRGRCRQRQRLRQLRICQRHQKEENHSASESAQNLSLYFWNCLWPVVYSRHTRKLFPLTSSQRSRFRPCSYLPFPFFCLWYLSRYIFSNTINVHTILWPGIALLTMPRIQRRRSYRIRR